MTKKIYNKLVRDNIPEIIKNSGKKANTKILSDTIYYKELKLKLKEETKEFLESGDTEELADILEVVECLAKYKGVKLDKLEKIKENKKKERGGFDYKIFLESVE